MTTQSILKTLLVTGALMGMSGVAMAGGNTIAASAKKSTVVFGASRILASGLAEIGDKGPDVCATIVNSSDKTALILLTLTDAFAATSNTTIAKGTSLGLCLEDAESVEVECLGPKKCSFTWSIDRF
ncbi:MAG: hypothetical protein JRG89_23160 [Deltaproteobacteria bacterium]|nr:hypothetical protein [Deltaproteobacteria bacterium]MBW2391304.1 hypothetical protein [Deltaproteobacteria bacterium]